MRRLLAGIPLLLFITSHSLADGFTHTRAEGSIPKHAEGSLLKHAEGSLLKRAEGSLLKHAEGSLLKRAEGSSSYIAIIIDDLGYNYSRGIQAANLPASLTYAILPYTRHARRLANIVHNSGKEVIVHLPMENLGNMPMGPGGLTNRLSRAEFGHAILSAVSRVPHAQGINNHMGSALTQERVPMQWLMEEIRALDFFFVDSRTTPNSVASDVARRNNLLSSSRDIFLDNDVSLYGIDVQFRKLVRLAKRKGTAIAIGHPYPETLAYLQMAIPRLADEGIEIIPASNLVALRQIIKLQSADQIVTGSE